MGKRSLLPLPRGDGRGEEVEPGRVVVLEALEIDFYPTVFERAGDPLQNAAPFLQAL